MVVGQLQGDAVGDDRALADGDVGEGTGVDEDRLPFERLQEVGIDRLDHPGGHRAGHVEVGRRHRIALLVVGHDDRPHPLP